MVAGNGVKISDLGVRTLSAIAMLAVAGGALWLGGIWWFGLVVLVAAGVMREWQALVLRFAPGLGQRIVWSIIGVIYIGLAAAMLAFMRSDMFGVVMLLMVAGAVIATDIGAYFAGRAIGGPKIAPAISPSKTWAGLVGGMAGAFLVVLAWRLYAHYDFVQTTAMIVVPAREASLFDGLNWRVTLGQSAVLGAGIAIVAQAGDFFESWMKRRAGVKDSGNLIPGHGGVFDRVDGLLAVCFVAALATFMAGSAAGLV